MRTVNRKLATAKSSATYSVMERAATLRAEGHQIISLSTGEPDFDTPEHVREAGIEAIVQGHTRYTQVAGLRPLREAVAAKFARENNLDVSWQDVIVTSGAKQAISSALAATLDEGDEVIIPAPYWVSYPDMVRLGGACPIIVRCTATDGFRLTPETLAAAITPRTRWLILNSPSNPTGAVYSRAELQALAQVLAAHPQILVMSDDIYEHLIFDGRAFVTMASAAPSLTDRILTINGVSKAYAMTGWRIGYAAGPKWLIEAMTTVQGQQTSGACSISQHAALAALTGPQDFIIETRQVFQRRRDFLVKSLNAAGLHCPMPEGAFYAFPSCTPLLGRRSPAGKLLEDDEMVATALLNEQGLACVHGSAFGLPGHLRLAYALDDAALAEACSRISSFCKAVV